MSTHSIPDNPMSRKEMYLAKSAGAQIEVPEPSTREEMYLKAIAENGSKGSSYKILGQFDTLAELETAHPTGNAGDAYLVGSPSHVYVWLTEDEEWGDGGEFTAVEGPKGEDGLGIKSVDINASNHLIVTYDDDTTEDTGELPGDGIKVYDTMPSEADLIAMSNNTYFRTLGFYSKDDGAGGLYKITGEWKRGTRVLQTSPRKVLHALNDDGADLSNEVHLIRYGVRSYNTNTDINWETITPTNTYASANSDIVESLYSVANYGANLVLPSGRFFFERPLALNRNGAQVGLRGDSSVWQRSNYIYSAYIAGTTLYFPFLTNGQTAVTVSLANIENVSIIGSPLTYDLSIDRTKTITAPDEVVTETIKTVDDTQVKCTGLSKTGNNITNVFVAQFWQGIYCQTSNIYITNVFVNRCHFGVNLGNDIKCIGVYGREVYTCVRIRGSLTSLVSTRVDSCVHVLSMIGGSGCTITDLDGDYCTESLIIIEGDNWSSIQKCVFTGIRGRCCTLKSYDTTQSDGVDVRTLQDTSGYGVIRVEGNSQFYDNIIELNHIGGSNPFDSSSNYATPKIVMTMANNNRLTGRNLFKFSDIEANNIEFFKKIHQASSGTVNASARFDVYHNTYIFSSGGNVITMPQRLLNDATPSSSTTYSSEKIDGIFNALKSIVTDSTDFADFQTKILELLASQSIE